MNDAELDLADVWHRTLRALDDADMTPMARSFYAESKRVANDRIKHDLGVQLKYPTYRDGLLALLKEDRDA